MLSRPNAYRVRAVQQEASQAVRRTLPTWLDGQTIAIIGTVLTVGAMILASTSALRAEMNDLRTELTDRIEDVRTELTARIEDVREELGTQIAGLDARLRVVEQSMEASRVGITWPTTLHSQPMYAVTTEHRHEDRTKRMFSGLLTVSGLDLGSTACHSPFAPPPDPLVGR